MKFLIVYFRFKEALHELFVITFATVYQGANPGVAVPTYQAYSTGLVANGTGTLWNFYNMNDATAVHFVNANAERDAFRLQYDNNIQIAMTAQRLKPFPSVVTEIVIDSPKYRGTSLIFNFSYSASTNKVKCY